MPEVASLNVGINTDAVKGSSADVRDFTKAATAAEKAAERWGMTTKEASRSADDFSQRTRRLVASLEFERAQLSRSAAEQAKYAALRRAGVSAMSAEGQAIAASVAALQAQRAAAKGSAEATTLTGTAAKAAVTAGTSLVGHLKVLAAAYVGVETIRKIWEAGLKAGDLGEQAEQIGVNTDQLQAYRFAGAQAGIETEQMDTAITKLAKSMGAAADGNKEMIALFDRLGVKLLDANGKLRPVADTLPEVAKGLLGVSSTTQRTADSMTLLGKGGAKMTTVLSDLADGNDKLIKATREQGGILEKDVIEAWDRTSDSMKRTGLAADVTYAKIGAPIATAGLAALETTLKAVNSQFTDLKNSIALIETHRGTFAQMMEVVNILSLGIGPRIVGKDAFTRAAEGIDKARTAAVEAEVELQKLQAQAGQTGMGYRYNSAIENQRKKVEATKADVAIAEETLRRVQEGPHTVTMPPTTVTGSAGAGNPTPKATGADPYAKAIESAKEYTALKNAETNAVGLSVDAAARLTHTQELVNKASADANKLTPTQIDNLKMLAGGMADADAKLAGAKFMDAAATKSKEYIATQEIERDTLFMSAEAADAYRIAQGYLNDAKSKGIELSAAEKAALQDLAAQQAAASEKTRQAKELYDLAKDSFVGFVTDMRQGLMDGKTVWESFGNAAKNALDKIASTLLDMAAKKLFESAFGGAPGSSSSGGGFLSSIGSFLGNIFGGAAGGGGLGGGSGITFANGAAFRAGNVVPFARGGVVNRPTLFPMANGMGLMGEAGPEAVMPLQRGPGGRLGVAVHGGARAVAPEPQRVEIHLMDAMLDAKIAAGSNVQITRREPGTVGKAVKQSTRLAPAAVAQRPLQREGEWRTAGAG